MNTPESVKQLAELLDEAVPGWQTLVNLDTLDHTPDSDLDVLTQVFGNFNLGWNALNLGYRPGGSNFFSSNEHLEKWKHEIRNRNRDAMERARREAGIAQQGIITITKLNDKLTFKSYGDNKEMKEICDSILLVANSILSQTPLSQIADFTNIDFKSLSKD